MQSTNQTTNYEEPCDNRQSRMSLQKDQSQVNMRGDVYAMNSAGQVTAFRFCHTDMTYFFAYDEKGELTAISSSTGWTWTKSNSDEFHGWVIRNYFDLWRVNEEDTGSVFVNQTGIHATGKQAELLALPEVGLG
jgi:hypothetical protein